MINNLISEICLSMSSVLNEEQLSKLKDTLILKLYDKEVTQKVTALSTIDYASDNNKMLNIFLMEMTVNKLSKRTLEQYSRQSRDFLDFVNKHYKEIDKTDVSLYLMKLESNGLTNTTVINSIRFIRPFFKWLVSNQYITYNPFDSIKKIKPDPIKKIILTDDEIEKVRDACISPSELALVDFLLSTGIRVGELENLTMDDIDFNTKTVTIYAPKTHKMRTGFLTARAVKHLIDYRKSLQLNKLNTNAVFVNRYGDALSVHSIERRLGKIKNRLNIKKKFTVHVFRKTFASTLKHRGCSLSTISILLGHSSPSITSKIYCEFDMNDISNEFYRCVA